MMVTIPRLTVRQPCPNHESPTVPAVIEGLCIPCWMEAERYLHPNTVGNGAEGED